MLDHQVSDEVRYRVFKILASDPNVSQRALADQLGVSLGKVNYCLQELVKKGFVKVTNFKNSKSKRAYLYYLTPSGLDEKMRVTYSFLRWKLEEFEALRHEIEQLVQTTQERPEQVGAEDSHAV